jgi:hypothetical protein
MVKQAGADTPMIEAISLSKYYGDFAATDDYISAIVKVGSPILYRLGESIEHTQRKYRVYPPKDFAKWADVCCSIIKHYNEEWAGGSRYDIRYWEIWNEPNWQFTPDFYAQLLMAASRAIHRADPQAQIVGLGGASIYTWCQQVMSSLGADWSPYMDQAAIHVYPQASLQTRSHQ